MQSTLKKTVLAGGLAASVAIMALTGCRSTADRTAGRQLDDRIVNSKVKDSLADSPVYKFPEVRVMTYGGVVQLSGFVNTDEQKTKATELARKVEGVHEVINNISLKPTAAGGASGRQQGVEGQAQSDRTLDADVKVDTRTEKEGAPVRENK
jgi:hyperosmotically inducible periplasmic protein